MANARSCRPASPEQKAKGAPKSLWAAVGAAAAASLCCLGPFLLVSLGIGMGLAGWLARLDPLRPWLATLALVLLGWAAWQQRRCGCGVDIRWWTACLMSALLITAPWWLAKLLG